MEVEENQTTSNSGDSSHNQSERSIQQSTSGASTSDASTIQSPSQEIQQLKPSESRTSSTCIGDTQSSTVLNINPTSSASQQTNSSNINQKPSTTSSSVATVEVTDLGPAKSDEKK